MAVYQNRDASPQSQALPLADEAPPAGAQVWVVAQVRGGVPQGQVMQSGKVQSNKPWIIIQFDNDRIVTNGASGAPVLNAAGEVVGVYSGHSKENGHVLGFIIPAPLIAKTIKEAAPPAQ
jgi:S1-C subfamily serine protease